MDHTMDSIYDYAGSAPGAAAYIGEVNIPGNLTDHPAMHGSGSPAHYVAAIALAALATVVLIRLAGVRTAIAIGE